MARALPQLPFELAGILSVWVETILYGIYCSLFFETVFVILKKKKTKTVPAKIFFGYTLLMFAVASAHIAINLYRMLRGYVWLVADPGPAVYFADLQRWDNIAHDALNAFMTWLGDSLVIYRCYIVWENNLAIVILPIILLIISIISNSVALHMFSTLSIGDIFSPSLVHWMNTIYAVAFVQNTMTTGLIAWRIWMQGKASRGNTNASFSLTPIIRILVESAAVYDMELLILIVLYAVGNNGQYIMQEASVPSVGIVFTLITVRLAMRSSPALITTEIQAKSIRFRTFGGATTTDGGMSSSGLESSLATNDAKDPVLRIGQSVVTVNESEERVDLGAESKYDIPMEGMLNEPGVMDEDRPDHGRPMGV
ncbi:hypothetical protein PLICRDRAFT_44102 [Plicaturopsis crispa FD-325 SS-3]|nr:hypothetical protein PLICRDRAFT_44102 [Plicaturopsis crispa FD-325 SS-3]